MTERIVVLDFGCQYNQLVARRVRECGVFSELLPLSASKERVLGNALSGIILTGGPDSTYEKGARTCPDWVFTLGVPVLGICYGMQYIAQINGGTVEPCAIREYGRKAAHFENHPLLEGMKEGGIVWMTHNDYVSRIPEGFNVIATTDCCPAAAFADDERKLYGVQFHCEVSHTENGNRIFKNFLKNICGLKCEWTPEGSADTLIEEIRAQVGDGRVVAGLSGGVDSSVAAVLVHKAIGDRLTCIFVDHGLLRQNEAQEVMEFYRDSLGLNIIAVDASERFLKKLEGVVDPERKRKIIGEEFIRVFEEQAKLIGDADYLLQGTIYPDVIESGSGGACVIKSHHNVGALPEDVNFKGIIEPLKTLFKDEVRAVGRELGIPDYLVNRQPFPGPGLGVRILGEVTEEKVKLLQQADLRVQEEVKKLPEYKTIWQTFAVLLPVKSVGVMGDQRTYEYTCAIRSVNSIDAMTADWTHLPYETLATMSNRIINEVRGINRVVYDISSKPPATIEWE